MDFSHPHFAEPEWLWLAWLGPLLLLLLHRYAAQARRRQLGRLADAEALHHLLNSHSPPWRLIKEILLALAVAGIGMAMARPQWGEQVEVTEIAGEDILFLIDCSKSMLAEDVRPNRLVRAKLAIQDFVQRHGRGRIGLVAFAGQAFLQCPLTYDYEAFREALTAIDDKTIPVVGTDIGRALEEAYLALEKIERRKIMVLLTDGEDLENTGLKMAEKLADQGVQVFTVGVGTPAGSPIKIQRDQGVADLLRDAEGKTVVSHLDETILLAIARATSGAYQPLGVLGEGMNRMRLALESDLSPGRRKPAQRFGVERFHLPVAVVTFLLVIEPLLSTRRRKINRPGA